PFDRRHRAARLALMLDDAAARVLVTQARLLDRIGGHAGSVVQLDADWPAVADRPTTAPRHSLHPDNTAYVIYTSGSTGTPKGVGASHRGIVSFSQNQSIVSWSAHETAIQIAPLAFDASTFEIWGALLNAAKLVV